MAFTSNRIFRYLTAIRKIRAYNNDQIVGSLDLALFVEAFSLVLCCIVEKRVIAPTSHSEMEESNLKLK